MNWGWNNVRVRLTSYIGKVDVEGHGCAVVFPLVKGKVGDGGVGGGGGGSGGWGGAGGGGGG